MTTRRKFLKKSLVTSASTMMASQFTALNTLAQSDGDYKALVCVFLLGGIDGHDCLIPYDTTSYSQWAAIRESVLADYTNNSRARANLAALNPSNSAALGGRSFGLAPQMQGMADLFADGDLAVIGNVGPLIEPATKSQIDAGSVQIPARIGSHNDQQSIWRTSNFEGATIGWGGRLLDLVGAQSPYAGVSVDISSAFLQGENTVEYAMSSGGVNLAPGQTNSYNGFSSDQLAILLEQYSDSTTDLASLYAKDYASSQDRLLGLNAQLADLLDTVDAGASLRSLGSGIANQFGMVADMMSLAPSLGISRQVFYIGFGTFDHHADIAINLPWRQEALANAMKAFRDHTVSAGLHNNVTTFTASDFGRTLQPNTSGTDHGWGNHHYVMGGAVNGRRILGEVPPPEFDHEQDNGRGRLIPTTSIEQYIAPIANWFGVSNSDLSLVFPNFGNFDADKIQLF